MKKQRLVFAIVLQVSLVLSLFSQTTIDSVCVGEVKSYHITPSFPAYNNTTGSFHGGVDTIYEWSIDATYGTIDPTGLNDTVVTVTWGNRTGLTQLSVQESIQDTLGTNPEVTTCTKTNTLAIHIFDTLKPAVLIQPQSQSGILGETYYFITGLNGTQPPEDFGTITYQWQYSSDGISWSAIPGATSNRLSVTVNNNGVAGQYQCLVTNRCNTVPTGPATLSLSGIPEIITHPISQTVCESNPTPISINVQATCDDSDTLFYQWQKRTNLGVWNNIQGATNNTLTFSNPQTADKGYYRCKVNTRLYPNLTLFSDSCYINIISNMVVYFTTHNVTCHGSNNGSITIDSVLNGESPFSYSWYPTGETTQTISNLAPGNYSVTVTEGSSSGCVVEQTVSIGQPDPLSFGIDTLEWTFANWINGQDNQSIEDIVVDHTTNAIYKVGSFETELLYGATSIFSGNTGRSDMFISKHENDETGSVIWSKRGSGTMNTYGKSVGVDGSGNVYVAGSFQRFATFDGIQVFSGNFQNEGDDYNGFVAKYNADGAIQFVISFGGIFNDYINAIHVFKNGQFVVTGSFEGSITMGETTITSGSAANVFVARFNSDGSLKWLRAMQNQPYDQRGTAIIGDVAENVYVSGVFQGNIPMQGEGTSEDLRNQQDVFLAQYDYQGTLKWVRTVTGSGFYRNGGLGIDYSECVYQTGSFTNSASVKTETGSVMHTYTSVGGSDGFVQKFDRNGSLKWATSIGGSGDDFITDMATDLLGNSYVVGSFNRNIRLGNKSYTTTQGIRNAFVAKYSNVAPTDPFTTTIPIVWSKVVEGTQEKTFTAVDVDNNKGIFLGGSFQEIVQFPGVSDFTAVHPKDGFFSKLEEIFIPKNPITISANCPEDSSGYAEIFITGGTQPYTFQWSMPNDTTYLNSISSGYYWFWVGDYYNTWDECGIYDSLFVDHIYDLPTKPLSITVDTNNFCVGSLPDNITLTAHGRRKNLTDTLYWVSGSCMDGTPVTGTYGNPSEEMFTLSIVPPTDTTTYYAYWESLYCGRSICDSITIFVKPRPVMPDAIVADTNNICQGSIDSIHMTAIGGSGAILEWLYDCASNDVIGTGPHFAIPAPSDTTNIYARWKNDCGFSECQVFTINVTPYPNTFITGVDTAYCQNAPIDTLYGTPEGGTWSGAGITIIGNGVATFDPSQVPVGVVEISYTASLAHCDSTYVATTTINPVPVPEITGLQPTYCHNDEDVLITGNYAPAGTFTCSSPRAIQNLGAGNALFKPSVAGVGGHTITYTHTNNFGCTNHVTESVRVIHPQLQIEGLNESYCTNGFNTTIYGVIDDTIRGGTFSGEGIVSQSEPGVAIFSPNLPAGEYTIKLHYVNDIGCEDSIEQAVIILDVPSIPDSAYILGNHYDFCYGSVDSLTLVAFGGFGDTMIWYRSNCNDITKILSRDSIVTIPAPSSSENYYVSWKNQCDISECYEVPVTVYELPDTTLTGRFAICQKDTTIIRTMRQEDCIYQWFDLETGELISEADSIVLYPTQNHWYRLIALNEHQCVDSADFEIRVFELPHLELGEDIYSFSCDSVEIHAGDGIGFDHYLWQDSSTNPTLWVSETGMYTVTVYSDGCTITDSVFVELCTDKFFVPNAFTPDGDGLNDVFRPVFSDLTLRGQIYIYARTGGLVFQTEDLSIGWDGTDLKGEPCPNGTYAYYIKYFMPKGNGVTKERVVSGSVILIR